ncbi:hypothetical protein HanIR_Chr03g0131841 [Helianthus annuus]|nr:hypothetical protein HanIR_Chr03g0131841 [Helianthus annuus]
MFDFYTRVCNFANYRVPFIKFLMKVLQFHGVHISQVNHFGLSRINHFELSCQALGWLPDLNVFRFFYEFGSAGNGTLLATGRRLRVALLRRSLV